MKVYGGNIVAFTGVLDCEAYDRSGGALLHFRVSFVEVGK
jgi:hypothetical protein